MEDFKKIDNSLNNLIQIRNKESLNRQQEQEFKFLQKKWIDSICKQEINAKNVTPFKKLPYYL